VTFVNPEPRKGIFVFARIAEVLSRRRPDIRLLLVEGIGGLRSLSSLGIDLKGLPNVTLMARTSDPREFHEVTKVLLMPSLVENAAMVAMEAMLNGTPVIASNRGALPEVVGDGGLVLDIPSQYVVESRIMPTAEEVEPWVEAIVRLWDDEEEYRRWSRAARDRSRFWQPDRLAPIYRDFFNGLRPQPNPPLLPEEPEQSEQRGKEAFPPLSTQAWSLAQAVATFVGDGFRTVAAAQYQKRLEICDACDRRSGSRCAACGCWVALKARGRRFTCPLGRWPEAMNPG
jgi:hypothetical protein